MGRRLISVRGLVGLLLVCTLLFCGGGLGLAAGSDDTNDQDFSRFLQDHEDDVNDLIESFGPKFSNDLAVAVLAGFAKIFILIYVIDFFLILITGWGLSILFAPTLQSFKRAAMWAGLCLAVNIVYGVINNSAIVIGGAAVGGGVVLFMLIFVVIAQMVITSWVYQLSSMTALFMNFVTGIVHTVLLVIVAVPILFYSGRTSFAEVLHEKVSTRMQERINEVDGELANEQRTRDDSDKAMSELRKSAEADERTIADLSDKLAERMKSDDYEFAALADLRTQGKLDDALTGYQAFATKFPNSPLKDAAAAAAVSVQKQRQDLAEEAAREAAEKKRLADEKEKALIDRMSKGTATLSDLRERLFGLSRDEVKLFLGPPDALASDRWGFAKKMVYDRSRGAVGLTVEFFEGRVRSVSYFYGSPEDTKTQQTNEQQ